MAHKLNDALNIIEGREGHICDDTCEYWRFPHLDVTCELSEVFSVKRGSHCYEYQAMIQED